MEPLSNQQLGTLEEKYGSLPADYRSWLRANGFGQLKNGLMVYSGPVKPNDIFSKEDAQKLSGFILVADDMAGFMVGYREVGRTWELVGIDSATMKAQLLRVSFSEYVTNES